MELPTPARQPSGHFSPWQWRHDLLQTLWALVEAVKVKKALPAHVTESLMVTVGTFGSLSAGSCQPQGQEYHHVSAGRGDAREGGKVAVRESSALFG